MDLSDCSSWCELVDDHIKNKCPQVKGTILLANEGINASLCGPEEQLDNIVALFNQDERFVKMDVKIFDIKEMVYNRLKVKCRPEIITFKNKDYDPKGETAEYVTPDEWNELINSPNTLVLDARNDFEYDLGSFPEAINPRIKRFSHFATYIDKNEQQLKDQKVAIFCTGGIRCEKLGRYMKQQGIEKVYQLQGGILKYLQEISEQENLWQGECFVFDERIGVDKNNL